MPGADWCGWNATALQRYRVEHTARRTGPSITDPGDDGVTFRGELVENLVRRDVAESGQRIAPDLHPRLADRVYHGVRLHTAREALDAEQKVYDSRKKLYDQGAIARKDLDQSAVNLIQARNQYEVAEKHLQALEAVGKKQELKAARGQLTSARGKYEGARAQLAYSEVRSPIDGVVTDRPLYPGEMAAAGSPLITVMDASEVVARTHVAQQDAILLKRGDPWRELCPKPQSLPNDLR